MTLTAIFLTSLMMGFSGAMAPGPLLTVTINESLKKGAAVGPKIILGHAILELLLGILILWGLGKYITAPQVKGPLALAGGAFLAWMAYGILKEAINSHFDLNLEQESQGKSINPIVAGVTVSASNPYWSLWWAGAGASSLMFASSQGAAGVTSFFSGHLLADLIWYSGVSAAVAGGRKIFTPIIYRLVLGICGIFLFGLAIYFIYSGVMFLSK